MARKTGNNSYIKKFNQEIVLDYIRNKEEISRAKLATLTGLSPTAIGKITALLIENNYIEETGSGVSSGGRRPVLLKLKKDFYYTIGIDIDTNYINVVTVDFVGELKDKMTYKVENIPTPEYALRKIKEIIKNIMSKKASREKLLGIGVSIPGIVNRENNKVIFAPNLHWNEIDILNPLIKELGIKIYIENEAKCSAIYEHWIGLCKGIDDFVCINIESGIGSGIYTNGKLYRGKNGSAGEIGHIVVDENGPVCGCGNYGCLETKSSANAIVENAKKMVRQGVVSDLNNETDISLDTIIKHARAGDETCLMLLKESARYIGIGISSIVNLLNPEIIVIGKEFTKYSDIVIEEICTIVNRKSMNNATQSLRILTSKADENISSALGAACIPLKKLFGK